MNIQHFHRQPASQKKQRKQNRSKTMPQKLLALTSTALCLPAYNDAQAAIIDTTQTNIAYRHSAYDEDNNGEDSRYSIVIDQLHFFHPISGDLDLSISALHETMSGASPWYITPDVDGTPIQVMSGASIEEKRDSVEVAMTRRFDQQQLTLKPSLGFSTENDYTALSGSLELVVDFNNKLSSVSFGFGFSLDEIEPVDTDIYPSRVDSEKKDSGTLFIGFAQIFSPTQVLQSSFSYTRLSGFLSDPYKQSFVANLLVADARPQERNQVAWLTRYRHFFKNADAAMHVDFRLYQDDWALLSHTLEFSWYQNIGQWQLVPGLRYYSQSQAAFYAPYYTNTRSDSFYSSDYRLSAYGAISTSLELRTTFSSFNFSLSYERYRSDADYAFKKEPLGNPGLVSFSMLSLDLSVSF